MLAKVDNCDFYTYTEGVISFIYYPSSGKVQCSNSTSTYRAIEHFARRSFEVDWVLSNIIRNIIYVTLPKYLTEEESLAILGKTKEELYAEDLHQKEVALEELLAKNVDNTTGNVIKEENLRSVISKINTDKKKGKADVAAWFNHYNIEEARPDNPVIILSTKSKRVIMEEGKKIIWSLFKQGRLRKLTKEAYQEKMDRFNLSKENTSVKKK